MAKYNSKGNISFKWTVSSVLTAVGQVRSIDHDASSSAIDVTDLDDTWREFVQTIVDGGEITLEIVHDPNDATFKALRTDWMAQTSRACELVVATRDRAFTGFILNCRESGSEGQALISTITVKVTGAITDGDV